MEQETDNEILAGIEKIDNAKAKAHADDLQRIEDIKQASILGFEAIGMIGDEMFARRKINLDNEMATVQGNYDTDMAMAGENELAKREATEKRIQAENKIKLKQAKLDKQQALFNIAISTAQGIAQVWAQTGIFGGAASIPVIAMGVLQASLVASRPLPKFDKGIKSAPSGYLEVAENRPEFVIQNGKMQLIEKPTITNQLQGAEIIGGAKSDMIMDAMKGGKIDDTTIQLMSGLQDISNNIKNLEIKVGFDNFGRAYTERQNKGRTTYADYYN